MEKETMIFDMKVLERQRMLNIKEAMFYLGVGKTKIYDLLQTQEIEGTNDGTIRIFRASCDRYQKRYKIA